VLPDTYGVAKAALIPTGEQEGKEGEDKENIPPSLHPPLLSQQHDHNRDSLAEEWRDDRTVKMFSESWNEEGEDTLPVRRERGRPATMFKWAGTRQIREAKKEARREEEIEARAKEALVPAAPKMRQWEAFLERETDIERELLHAPTLDLQSRVLDETTQIFRAVSCSLKMKGSLVHALKEAAAVTRAAMTILADRAREREMVEDSGPSERERRLESQIEVLKKKVENLERQAQNPPKSPTPDRPRKRARRRVAIVENDEEMGVPAPPIPQIIPIPTPNGWKTIRGKGE